MAQSIFLPLLRNARPAGMSSRQWARLCKGPSRATLTTAVPSPTRLLTDTNVHRQIRQDGAASNHQALSALPVLRNNLVHRRAVHPAPTSRQPILGIYVCAPEASSGRIPPEPETPLIRQLHSPTYACVAAAPAAPATGFQSGWVWPAVRADAGGGCGQWEGEREGFRRDCGG